jgi:hypothetical protein
MKTNLFFALIVIVVFASCSSNKNAKELKTIDSLYTVIDTVNVMIEKADYKSFEKMYATSKENLDLLKENFDDKKDSTWSTITLYSSLNKHFKSFSKKFPQFIVDVEESKKQLDNLKADIKAGKIEKDTVDLYVSDEANAMSKTKKKKEGKLDNGAEEEEDD